MCYSVCPPSCSWAGRGVIDVPLQEVAEFLKRTENNLSWDKYLVVSTTSLINIMCYIRLALLTIGSQHCEDAFS